MEYNNTVTEFVETKSTRYQYSYVDMETVIANTDEYIIPACQPACKSLWNKNIETFMVSNNDDNYLYVLLGALDDNNRNIIEEAMKTDSRFFYSDYRHTFGIKVAGNMENIDAIKELEELTEVFTIQDTFRFKNPDEFLKEYKISSSKTYEVQSDGTLLIKENPDLSDVTFEEALAQSGKDELYIQEEGRIYDSPMYLMWHKRYEEYIKNIDSKKSKHNSI